MKIDNSIQIGVTMHKSFVLLASAALLTTACNNNDASSGQAFTSIPTLELAATHAIYTPLKVTDTGFLDNETAPWLGGLLLVGADGSLNITDIEGENTLPAAKGIDAVSGLNSGLFISTATDGRLQAYLQNADMTSIENLSLSGPALRVETICASPDESQTRAAFTAIGTDESMSLNTLTFETLTKDASSLAEYKIASRQDIDGETSACAWLKQDYFMLTQTKSGSQIARISNGEYFKADFPVALSGLAAMTLNEKEYLLTIWDGSPVLLNAQTLKPSHVLKISDGLSIQGLENASFAKATHANYGGGAFNTGLIALGDADTQRIVFISRNYMERQINSANAAE